MPAHRNDHWVPVRINQVECPRCNTTLTPGMATIVFQHAPTETKEQRVEALTCPCGEFYVPGDIAKKAHHRAFGLEE